MEFNSKASYSYNNDAGEHGTDGCVESKCVHDRVDYTACNTCQGIYLFAEDERYLIDEHVA